MNPLLPALQRAIDLLAQCSLALARAATWADRDRFPIDPRAVIAGPMKYWKWRSAKKLYAQAARELAPVRAKAELPEAELTISKLDILNDLLGYSDITPSRLDNMSGPSPVKQLFGAEINAQQRFETARLEVDNLLSEVGALHAKLRAA